MDQENVSNTLAVLMGGEDLEVTHADGRKETVRVRQLPIRLLAAYGAATGDEGRLLELFTGCPPDWVDGLTVESQEAVIELGDRLNLDPLGRWAARRQAAGKRLSALAPGLLAAMVQP